MNIRIKLSHAVVAVWISFFSGISHAADAPAEALSYDTKTVSVLAPFVSDGCSVPKRFAPASYEGCCTRHDYAYWIGGTLEDKNRADATLVNCIRARGASEFTVGAWQMMLSNFGIYRWGAKWVPHRANAPLNASEWNQIQKLAPAEELTALKVRSVKALKQCPETLLVVLKSKTTLEDANTSTCYPLVNADERDDRQSTMIFSNACDGGYFIFRTRSSKSEFASEESLGGYGLCADKMLPLVISGVAPKPSAVILEPIRQ